MVWVWADDLGKFLVKKNGEKIDDLGQVEQPPIADLSQVIRTEYNKCFQRFGANSGTILSSHPEPSPQTVSSESSLPKKKYMEVGSTQQKYHDSNN